MRSFHEFVRIPFGNRQPIEEAINIAVLLRCTYRPLRLLLVAID